MGLKVYLPLAVVAFVAATTGADVIARTSIGGETPLHALRDHLYWASVQFVGTMLLLSPFVIVAVLSALTENEARSRSAVLIFAAAMLTLLYFYFEGHQAKEHAMLEEKWTAAALSIGLLPFFIGIPIVFAVAIAGAFAAKFDGRVSAERQEQS